MLDYTASPARRLNSRVSRIDNVWVYWQCDGQAETSFVQDISLGGVFLITPRSRPMEARAELHFLVQEGQIRTEAVIRHVKLGRGLGMKFTAIRDEDRPHLQQLMARLRTVSCTALRSDENLRP
jgi:c-di-GMP-binding flagellar brake protein YcgR